MKRTLKAMKKDMNRISNSMHRRYAIPTSRKATNIARLASLSFDNHSGFRKLSDGEVVKRYTYDGDTPETTETEIHKSHSMMTGDVYSEKKTTYSKHYASKYPKVSNTEKARLRSEYESLKKDDSEKYRNDFVEIAYRSGALFLKAEKAVKRYDIMLHDDMMRSDGEKPIDIDDLVHDGIVSLLESFNTTHFDGVSLSVTPTTNDSLYVKWNITEDDNGEKVYPVESKAMLRAIYKAMYNAKNDGNGRYDKIYFEAFDNPDKALGYFALDSAKSSFLAYGFDVIEKALDITGDFVATLSDSEYDTYINMLLYGNAHNAYNLYYSDRKVTEYKVRQAWEKLTALYRSFYHTEKPIQAKRTKAVKTESEPECCVLASRTLTKADIEREQAEREQAEQEKDDEPKKPVKVLVDISKYHIA